MYSIVVFEGPNDSVGTVSTVNRQQWPPRDYGKAIRRNKEPEDSWSTYPVQVLSKNPINDLTSSDPSTDHVNADRAHLVPNDTIDLSTSEYTALYNTQIAFEKQVMTVLAGIRADIRELLQRTCSKPTTHDLPMRRIPFDFPCQTIKVLMSLNEWIKADDNFAVLGSYLASIGGQDVGKIVLNILVSVISGDKARQINCSGAHMKQF
ncbi:unnamed protein product [Orchesella dallaii]|uniref:Uncharacterized protein n=1 Tax=Orchesella dallaii TaxID=48710 RepID=A0ABP1S883_9HEXA